MRTYQITLIGQDDDGHAIKDRITVGFKGRLRWPNEIPAPIKKLAEMHTRYGWGSAEVTLTEPLIFDREKRISPIEKSYPLATFDAQTNTWVATVG